MGGGNAFERVLVLIFAALAGAYLFRSSELARSSRAAELAAATAARADLSAALIASQETLREERATQAAESADLARALQQRR